MRGFWLTILFFCCLVVPARAVPVLVTYGDSAGEGFNDVTLGAARRNAFEAAAAQWGQRLNGSVSVRINAFFDPQGGTSTEATLAFAGPESFFENWTGAPQPDVYYAVALANQLADTDLDPGFVDITATFNTDVDNNVVLGSSNFYYGTDLQAGGDVDFYTIALHELCHGFGFLDTVNTDGSYALTNPQTGTPDPSVYDLHLATGAASSATLIISQSQAQRANGLVSNSLFFSGPNTRAANSNLNAKLYAPTPYEFGSSVSHLDEVTFSPPPDGNAPSTGPEELMTPLSSINMHNIGPVLTGIMKDLGWSFPTVTLPTISVSDVVVSEGNSGTTSANVTFTLSAASTSNVTVNYTTTNNTATAGSDYTTQVGTLTFTPGQTSRTISLAVTTDTIIEPNETFFVDLTSATGATIADNRGIITINNDDSPTISINDVSLAEGNSGTTNATLTVTLSAARTTNVTVNFTTANASALAGSDYVAKTGTVTFTAGQTSRTIVVAINGDTAVEASETFFVDLSSPVNATIADNRGIVTISNDDSLALSINDVSLSEGSSGTSNATLTVTLSAASATTVSVNFTTANASALAGSDYVAKTGTVTFTAGQTSRTIVVAVNGDTAVESDENFFVDLSSPVGANIADNRGVVTIINDDSSSISINNVSLNETNAASTNATLTVILSAVSSSNVTVNYTTTGGTAAAGSDYLTKSGTLTFTPGQTSQTIVITVNGDTVVESDENFFVDLSSPVGATLGQARGTVTILNDDNPDPNAPTNISLSPQVSSNAPNTVRTFTTVHSDPNGNANISQAMLQMNTNTSGVGALRCYYAASSNLLFFLNDAGTGFIGGFAPGSANVISNSRGSLDCANTTVTRNGNNITIAWRVTATTELSGLRLNCFLFTRNKSNLIDNFEAFGNWLITGNVAPVNSSLSPVNTTANLGVAQDLTTVYSDANGASSLSQVLLRVGTPLDDCVQLFYDQLSNKLYLLNDTASAYLGGFAPGSANVISNSRGSLDCAGTTVTRSGNALTIKWRISVTNSPWAGTKQNVWMFARDRGNLLAPFAVKGSWTVSGNTAPSNVDITPSSLSSPLNSQQTVGARYQDANGATNLSQAILRIGTSLSSGLQVFYDVQNNLLYLANDAGTGYIGGFAPGSNNTITNARGKLHCLSTQVSQSGFDLFINWSISLTSTSYANTTQGLFLFCRDRGNLLDNYEQLGTWQISGGASKQTNPQDEAPFLSSIEANALAQTITLNFADPLPVAAGDANNFVVQVRGQTLSVSKVLRNASSVILNLQPESIQRGDILSVAWRNLPGSGEATVKAD